MGKCNLRRAATPAPEAIPPAPTVATAPVAIATPLATVAHPIVDMAAPADMVGIEATAIAAATRRHRIAREGTAGAVDITAVPAVTTARAVAARTGAAVEVRTEAIAKSQIGMNCKRRLGRRLIFASKMAR